MADIFDMGDSDKDTTMSVAHYVQNFVDNEFVSNVMLVDMTSEEITNALKYSSVQGGRVNAFFTVPMKVGGFTEDGMLLSDGVALLLGVVQEVDDGAMLGTISLVMDEKTTASLANHMLHWCSIEMMHQTLVERMEVEGDIPPDIQKDLDDMKNAGFRVQPNDD